MDVYPKRNIKKALKELGIEKYCISYDSVSYTIYV
jgi:DNA-directed RNA polymerase subunit N (RpoN/RPB10)